MSEFSTRRKKNQELPDMAVPANNQNAPAAVEVLNENFLKDFFWRLVSSVLWPIWQPIQNWILNASWLVRAGATGVVGLVVIGGVHPSKTWEKIEVACLATYGDDPSHEFAGFTVSKPATR